MTENDLTIISPMAAAGTLAVLWILESLLPPIIEERSLLRGARIGNLVLAGCNVVVATAFAGLTLLVTEFSAGTGFGLLHVARTALPDTTWMAVLLVACSFLLLDLWAYLFHVLAHHVPLLWRFHALHHNADHYEVTLALRFHVVEIAVQAALSLPVFLLLGVGIQEILLYQLFLVPLAFFHHWNVRLPSSLDRIMCWVLVTPGMHVIHHSRWDRETDSNFSAVFSFWDRMFGSYRWRARPETVSVGLDGFEPEQIHSLRGMFGTGLRSSPSLPGEQPDPELIPDSLRERDGIEPDRSPSD